MFQELLNIRSGGMSEAFANQLKQNPNSIPEMIDQIENPNPIVAWRAAWVIDKLVKNDPLIMLPYHLRLIKILKQTPSNGVRRHLTRILSSTPSQASEDGVLVDLCFEWILNPKIPVAVKVNAMQLILELCKIYPDLKPELRLTIEAGVENGTPAYKSCAKKILQNL